MAITGTLELTLKEGTNAQEFVQMMINDYNDDLNENDIEVSADKKTIAVDYDCRYTDIAEELIENYDVEKAFGMFVCDGRDMDEPMEFGLLKEDGKAVEIFSLRLPLYCKLLPIFLAKISDKMLLEEVNKRGLLILPQNT